MPEAASPELVFISGPQEGEHAVIWGRVAIAGRSPDADIYLAEEAISRQQMRFELDVDGWTVANLSTNGTWIAGRRYKSQKKKLLLETGDILAAGNETQMLYVAPEDDAYAVAEQYRKDQEAEAEAPETGEAAPDEAAAPAPPPPAPAEAPEPEEAPENAEPIEEDEEAAARKAKLRKYAVGAAIYVGVLVFLVVMIQSLGGEEAAVRRRPRLMEREEIEEILTAPIPVETPLPREAERLLNKALTYWDNRNAERDNLFRAVKHFRLYLAHRQRPTFSRSDYSIAYNEAKEDLVEEVVANYNRAYIYSKNGDWGRAAHQFAKLRRMLPFEDEPRPEPHNPLAVNIREHLAYVMGKLRAAN